MIHILVALVSAFLFGASTPLGKLLLDSLPPFQLAGLLYLGAALGVLPFSLGQGRALARMGAANKLRLAGAIGFGGVLGPVCLLFGLQSASASSVAMWLNLELVATAVLGYFLFNDHLGRLEWLGVAGTLGASLILSWQEGAGGGSAFIFLGIAGICWGLDNHLTALIDGITPAQSTFWKGLTAGTMNLGISWMVEPFSLEIQPMAWAVVLGMFAYGVSISLYIRSAQNLGATRSQMIFSAAPFFGVVLSFLVLKESLNWVQAAAAGLLILSLGTLFRDRHGHSHTHEPVSHTHDHCHDDDHHNHGATHPGEYHSHWHHHDPVSHGHPHWPDIHHRHTH
ncbi:MAG: DMT family transporter [Desulfobacteraceae bacterium]|nr:DMT family transporter [Desulfobacteraceae bacterium]